MWCAHFKSFSKYSLARATPQQIEKQDVERAGPGPDMFRVQDIEVPLSNPDRKLRLRVYTPHDPKGALQPGVIVYRYHIIYDQLEPV